MPKLPILVSVVIPGLGHVLLDRCVQGVLIFLLYLLTLDALVLTAGPYGKDPTSGLSRLGKAPVGAAVLVWAWAIGSSAYIGWRRRRIAETIGEDKYIREGLTHYLRDELDRAADRFVAALEINESDVDALFHLAMTYKAMRMAKEAVKTLRDCRTLDLAKKWEWEIQRELAALEEELPAKRKKRRGDSD